MKRFLIVTLIFALVLLVSCRSIHVGKTSEGNVGISDASSVPSDLIGVEKAKQIALEKAGLSENDVRFDRTELDYENGIWVYEVEFETPTTEYDAEIKADDGTILKWEFDNN